jgi:hypothetical protein
MNNEHSIYNGGTWELKQRKVTVMWNEGNETEWTMAVRFIKKEQRN